MAETLIAQGNSFDNLQQMIADRELPVGTRVTARMTVNHAYPTVTHQLAFDGPLAEQIVQDKIGDGYLRVVDVWYNESDGFAYVSFDVISSVSISGMVGSSIGMPWTPNTRNRREEDDLEGNQIAFMPVLTLLAVIGVCVLAGFLIALLVSFIRVTAAITGAIVGLPKPILIALGIGGAVLAGFAIYKFSRGRSFEVGPSGFKSQGEQRYLSEGRG